MSAAFSPQTGQVAARDSRCAFVVGVRACSALPRNPPWNCRPWNPGSMPPETMNILGLRSLVAGHDVKGDFFTLDQRFIAAARDGRVVDKNVLTGLLCDETETLLVIEPLHFAACHI